MSLYNVTAFSLKYDGPVRNLCLIDDGYLRYDDERIVYSSTAKFGYEESKNGLGVHLRCLHNNKYLVREKGKNWITATAKDPVEDLSSDNCTLFKVDIVGSSTMKWTHLASKTIVSISAPEHPTNSYYLCAAPKSKYPVETTPIDVERIIKLPKTVVLGAFKDANNYNYLQADNYNKYLSLIGNDRNRKEAWFNIIPLTNGDVRIKCVKSNLFWKRCGSDGEIRAEDPNQTSTDPNTFFKVARLSDDTIALINLGDPTTPMFCQRDGSRLKANIDTGVREAGFKVEEPVVSKDIDIEYRLDDARIYDVKPRSWLSQVAYNQAKEGDLQTTLSIAYTEAHRSTFTATATVYASYTATATVKASIPIIAKAEAKLVFTAGASVTATMGKTIDKSQSIQFSATVIIPPGQKRRARIMANEAKCDVPFSYMLTELSADNTVTRTKLHDGVYHGMNGYEFHVQIFDPAKPDELHSDEPLATLMLPDTHAREKIYWKENQ